MRGDICLFVSSFNLISQKNNKRDNSTFKFKTKHSLSDNHELETNFRNKK